MQWNLYFVKLQCIIICLICNLIFVICLFSLSKFTIMYTDIDVKPINFFNMPKKLRKATNFHSSSERTNQQKVKSLHWRNQCQSGFNITCIFADRSWYIFVQIIYVIIKVFHINKMKHNLYVGKTLENMVQIKQITDKISKTSWSNICQ